MSTKKMIQNIIDKETNAWNMKDVEKLISVFHHDMVWPWPKSSLSHDPLSWEIVQGRYNKDRWCKGWQSLFDSHDLIHNERLTQKIEVSKEQDGAFAVVDIDTLWRHKQTGTEMNWKGRTCKTYTLIDGEWKMIHQVGVLDYSDLRL